ncbi:integrase arm-type DNA-binding domain-containing protein [Escherichia coli]
MWRFRYKRPGSTTRTTITLGYYPVMSLASARTLHAEKLALLVQGLIPANRPGKQQRRKKSPLTVCLSMWRQNGLP